ncbi:MAG: hypothetical protein WCB95_09295, partial [Aeromicrobium sp.]
GFRTGYSVGTDDGYINGQQEDREQADLRDEVADEAEQEPIDDGGSDLGDELTPSPDPTPTETLPASSINDDQPPQQSGGVPWWPLSFAVAATAWFVTRRRRLDAEDAASQ